MATDINKLISDIAIANNQASMFDDVEDKGACNFDAPIINLKLSASEKAQLKEFLTPVNERGYKDWYFVEVDLKGQAYRRTKMSIEASEALKEAGYKSRVYYELD